MSCRTGPLRVERPLRGAYTGLGNMILLLPPLVGIIIFRPTGGPMLLISPRQVKKACERPPHAQWARPAGHKNRKSLRIAEAFSLPENLP